MTTEGKGQQVLSNVEVPALPPRRSARHQSQTLPTGSSSQPITIPDSPLPLPSYDAKDSATTDTKKEDELIQVIPKLELVRNKQAQQIEGINGDRELIQAKQAKLLKAASQNHGLGEYVGVEEVGWETLKGAVDATLVFAQEEAGTAICVSEKGLILTCAHCVAETAEELDMEKVWILLFSSGQIVQAKTVHWDEKRDLALLHIIGAQTYLFYDEPSIKPPRHSRSGPLREPPSYFAFPYVQLAESAPKTNAKLLCIGHPGSEDLETSITGVATGYDVLHISQGRFRGYARGQDRQDNSEIGALRHDCWTYWGHSGAPLVEMATEGKARSKSGRLVGLHSSWDEETGMRRGVGWEALRAFLEEGEGMGLL